MSSYYLIDVNLMTNIINMWLDDDQSINNSISAFLKNSVL